MREMRDGSFLSRGGFSTRYSHFIRRFPMSTFLTSHLASLISALGSYFTSRFSTRYSVSYFTSQLLGWRRVTSHISVYGHKNHPSLSQGVLAGLIRRVCVFGVCPNFHAKPIGCWAVFAAGYIVRVYSCYTLHH